MLVDLGSKLPEDHEQAGSRPCVVVADPARVHPLRYPVVIVVPLSTARVAGGTLYPKLLGGAGGLNADSTALIDQVCAADVRRVKFRIGKLSNSDFQPLREVLRMMLEA